MSEQDRSWAVKRSEADVQDFLDEAPVGECSACHRKTWEWGMVGRTCYMPQPNGGSCMGIFSSQRTESDVSESLPVPRDLLLRVLHRMMLDTVQINSEWGVGAIRWDQEGEIAELAELLGLHPGEWPELTATQRKMGAS